MPKNNSKKNNGNNGGKKMFKKCRNKPKYDVDSDEIETSTNQNIDDNSIKLAMWDYLQCNPKICSGRKLFRLNKLKLLQPKQSFNGIVLAPNATEPINLERDLEIMKKCGLAVVDCSWARVESTNLKSHKFGRTLPYMIAANSINYGKPYKLNCAEALAGMLKIAGYDEQAEDIMNCFTYGSTFLSLNDEYFEQYKKCLTKEMLVQCEESIMNLLLKEKENKKHQTIQEFYAEMDQLIQSDDSEENNELNESNDASEENNESDESDDASEKNNELDESYSNESNLENDILNVEKLNNKETNVCENNQNSSNLNIIDTSHYKSEEVRILDDTEIELLNKQDKSRLDKFRINKFNKDIKKNWDLFYKRNKTNFFKDRHWIEREFPEISIYYNPSSYSGKESLSLLEVGCGVGNFIFPLIEEILNCEHSCNIKYYCCDFSDHAISLLKQDIRYIDASEKGYLTSFVLDLTQHKISKVVENLNIVTCIFVLSAINPLNHKFALNNLLRCLKMNGRLLIRDYGIHDFAQIRFGYQTKMDDNWYVRQDGTYSYFFSIEYMKQLVDEMHKEDSSRQYQFNQCTYVYTKTENKSENLFVDRIFIQSVIERIK